MRTDVTNQSDQRKDNEERLAVCYYIAAPDLQDKIIKKSSTGLSVDDGTMIKSTITGCLVEYAEIIREHVL